MRNNHEPDDMYKHISVTPEEAEAVVRAHSLLDKSSQRDVSVADLAAALDADPEQICSLLEIVRNRQSAERRKSSVGLRLAIFFCVVFLLMFAIIYFFSYGSWETLHNR